MFDKKIDANSHPVRVYDLQVRHRRYNQQKTAVNLLGGFLWYNEKARTINGQQRATSNGGFLWGSLEVG